jgi:hypothetical protein
MQWQGNGSFDDYKHARKEMDEICIYLLSIPRVDRCSNEEVDEWIPKLKILVHLMESFLAHGP